MSTVEAGTSGLRGRARRLQLRGRLRTVAEVAVGRLTADVAVIVGLATALSAIAFYAQGGVAIGPNTYTEVLLVAAGGLLGALAIAGPSRHARPAPVHGGWALGLLGLLAATTALSVIWSIDSASSWLETNRTLAYLATFGAGLALVRIAPGRWAAVLGGVALACVLVCGYALATKVLPGALAPEEIYARLRAPFGYWNAVGLMAASGVPPLLWLAARRSGHAAVNALAYPGLGVLLVCLLLSYSRGALLALLVGLVAWFAVVPLRLRGAVALLVSGAASAAVVAWAFAQPGLTQDRVEPLVRADAGHELGVLLVLLVVVLTAAGLGIGFAVAARPPAARTRVLAGRLVAGAIAVSVAAGIGALAAAPGGIDGQVSRAWAQLTDVDARTPANTPNRLTATASVRARYWSEALEIHARSELVGVGAGAYGLARKRIRTGDLDVQHAHGYIVQTLADLGWIGLLISLAAASAWLAAALRATGADRVPMRLRRRRRHTAAASAPLMWDAERVGIVTLAIVVGVFAVHSLLDWTWFVPANTVLALLCAGWVAGRGPLRQRLAEEGPTGVVPAAERAGILSPRRAWAVRERLVRWRPAPYRTAVAAGVLLLAMTVTWTIVQPLRAQHAGDAATARLAAGNPAAASEIARIGTRRNPLSPEPWWELAGARAIAGDLSGAERALERAVRVQPASAEAWRRLGRLRMSVLGEPREALQAFQAALYLDPHEPRSRSDVIEASRALAVTAP